MISVFAEEDLAACSRLYVDAFNAPPANESWQVEDAAQRLEDVFFAPRVYGFCSSAPDGTLAGFGIGRLDRNGPEDYFFLQELCVLPAHQRQGHGIALLRALRERLPQVTQWYLLTDRDGAASEFYEKRGFRPAQRTGVFLCAADAMEV